MSFGKAVVATRAPSTETYIQHGVTGLLVEPGDVDGMRQAILHLWRNPDEAKRMGQAARRRFEENHTIDKLARRIYGIAQQVVDSRIWVIMKSETFLNRMLPGLFWFILALLLISQPMRSEHIRQLLDKRWR